MLPQVRDGQGNRHHPPGSLTLSRHKEYPARYITGHTLNVDGGFYALDCRSIPRRAARSAPRVSSVMADRLKEKVALARRWPGGSDYATRSMLAGHFTTIY